MEKFSIVFIRRVLVLFAVLWTIYLAGSFRKVPYDNSVFFNTELSSGFDYSDVKFEKSNNLNNLNKIDVLEKAGQNKEVNKLKNLQASKKYTNYFSEFFKKDHEITHIIQYSGDKNLSHSMKTYSVYDLQVDLPTNWKVESGFDQKSAQRKGSLLAIDNSKQLNYPRNLEIKVIPERLYINSSSIDDLKDYIKTRMKSSYRGLKDFYYDESRSIKINNKFNTIMIFASFRLNDSEFTRIHLAIPYGRYYFLLIYTDLTGMLTNADSESFEIFWNVVESINLPKKTFFTGTARSISLVLLSVISFLILVFLFFNLVRLIGSIRVKNFDSVKSEMKEKELEDKLLKLKRKKDLKKRQNIKKKLDNRKKLRKKMAVKKDDSNNNNSLQKDPKKVDKALNYEQFAISKFSEDEKKSMYEHKSGIKNAQDDDTDHDQTFMA